MSATLFPVITTSLPLASRMAEGELACGQFDAWMLGCFDDAGEIVGSVFPSAETSHHRPPILAMAGNAPYLARLIARYPEQLHACLTQGLEASWVVLMGQLAALPLKDLSQEALMQHLRHFKARAALTTAFADVSGQWKLMQVTRALSDFAEQVVTLTIRFLVLQAMGRGELVGDPEAARPEHRTGIIVLGMGKLGAGELNYSSDIDLIILFDKDVLPYTGSRNPQHFMNKIASDLTFILQERTADGYVFRTDLRLRPDPMSTPLAVTTAAAMTYYETVGQNWERAAMIKARPLGGDRAAAEAFMRDLVPFVWRKTLDFATIADIHSIKRQMNALKGADIAFAGHNIKTGAGGIREIEFFVQTQQLVWGGRIPELRVRGTLEALDGLCDYELIIPEVRDALRSHYHYLRMVEHRLQMRNDEQTHTLPKEEDALREVAVFCGYRSLEAFSTDCTTVLQHVHAVYTDSMEGTPPLAVEGNLVFTGVEADPDTLETLARMGYGEGQRISDIIQGWHRGNRRSTRSKRSRQVLTELVPALLTALSKTASPDTAFFHFDDFIDRLPSGAQIFSLLHSRHELLSLLADILGSAPALGDTLSNDPALLDSVLEADFFLALPSKTELENLVTDRLRYAHDYEQKMVYLRIVNNEKRFQAGVHLLQKIASPAQVGLFLSDVAEVVLQATMQEVWAQYAAEKLRAKEVQRLDAEALLGIACAPNITPFAVVALGKLGGREMTFGSDLDIIFLYDDADESDSEARMHMHRISQRLVHALTLLSREGRLYEVDTRLRPGGSDGPLATSLSALDRYFSESAWTYEFMALSRARVVATNHPAFAARVEATIRRHILNLRDPLKLLHDVLEMRERIAKQFPTHNPWALKHVRGGMVDLDFIAQFLVLRYGPTHPAVWHRSALEVFESSAHAGLLPSRAVADLREAKKFLSDVMSILRLSASGGVITDDAPLGLQRLLVDVMGVEDFAALKACVERLESQVRDVFAALQDGKLG